MPLAEHYVRLVLALGQHDADYVDAFYGPPEWQKDAEAPKRDAGRDRSRRGRGAARAWSPPTLLAVRRESTCDSGTSTRRASSQRCAPACRCSGGRTLTFDEESQGALRRRCAFAYGRASSPRLLTDARVAAAGTGHAERALRLVPQSAIHHSEGPAGCHFKAAIEGCRSRTLHALLTAGRGKLHRRIRHEQELERLQLVQGQLSQRHSGQHRSADLLWTARSIWPATRAIPGHHVYNVLLEQTSCASAAGWSSPSTRCFRRSRSLRKARRTTASTSRFRDRERLQFERDGDFPDRRVSIRRASTTTTQC